MDRAVRANTLLAHRLLWLAEQRGVQEAVKERLLRAYFSDGRNVGDPDALADLAAECRPRSRRGPRASWRRTPARPRWPVDLTEARELGITAVPTYVFDGRWSVPGRAGPGHVPPGARAGRRAGGRRHRAGRDRAVTVLHVERLGAGPRLVARPRLHPDRALVGADRRRPGARPRGRVSSTRPATAARRTSTADLPAGAELLGAAGGPRHLRRLLDGRPVGAAPRAWRGRTSSTAWCSSAPPPASRTSAERAARRRRRRAAGRPSWSATASRSSSSDGWPSRCSPSLPPDAAGLDDRRRNTVGRPGLQPAPGRHRHASSRCGISSPSCRCPCSWWPASTTSKLRRPSEAAWPEAIGRNATFALVPGAGHACHLEQPDEFLAALRGPACSASAAATRMMLEHEGDQGDDAEHDAGGRHAATLEPAAGAPDLLAWPACPGRWRPDPGPRRTTSSPTIPQTSAPVALPAVTAGALPDP